MFMIKEQGLLRTMTFAIIRTPGTYQMIARIWSSVLETRNKGTIKI